MTPNKRKNINARTRTMFSARLESVSDNGKRRGPKMATTRRPSQPNTAAVTIQAKIRARLVIYGQ